MMTAEEYLRKMQDPHWYGEQDENGVDLSLIRENLKLTPTERLRKGDRATRDCLRIRSHERKVGIAIATRTSFDELARRATTETLGDLQVRVIDLDDLIRIKQHLGRPKDRESLLQLLAIKRIRTESSNL